MTTNSPFKSRTISVVNDLSIEEQLYLYNKTKELKDAVLNNKDLSAFKLNDKDIGIYLLFLEDSTRTKESFRNAALFHNAKLNPFQVEYSSFNKMESYADTLRMLSGYSGYSIFIIRSKLEGVCRWLELSVGEYAERNNIPSPSFINAGDGKHEHPTQEFLDEFSFYEHKNWQLDHIHIALIGDLYHGRTTHSKADGLRIFKEVQIDLIAPDILKMPDHYIDKMKANGFKIRFFNSLEEYISQKEIAKIWYFTRLQLERMGEDIRDKADYIRNTVTFKKEFIEKLPSDIKFFHPLPRHREHPTIPFFLDKTEYNGWEQQSINGYYTRIIELGMTGGKIGSDFTGTYKKPEESTKDFVEEIQPHQKEKQDFKIGIIPITNGLVIDHIGKGDTKENIWDHINNIRRILNLNEIGSHGVFQSGNKEIYKGIMAFPNILEFNRPDMKRLAAIAPGCTLNLIKDKEVIHKYRINMPPRIYNFKDISCKNKSCISHPIHSEKAQTIFYRADRNIFTCGYCETPHKFKQIWKL